MTPAEMLQHAVQAARAGERATARALLLDLVKIEPENLAAWLWLSDLLEDPATRIEALERALSLQPNQPAVQARLDQLRQLLSPPGPPAESPSVRRAARIAAAFQRAQQMALAGEHKPAALLLQRITAADPRHAEAWQLWSQIETDLNLQMAALEQVIALHPSLKITTDAQERLEHLQAILTDPWKQGRLLEDRGQWQEANQLYQSIAALSRQPAERLEAARRIEALRLKQEARQLTALHPNIDLARLSAGPPLLFALLLFGHSGLNLAHISLLQWLEGTAILCGSAAATISSLQPAHPWWIRHAGYPGNPREREKRLLAQIAGWALLLFAFAAFLLEAIVRDWQFWLPLPR